MFLVHSPVAIAIKWLCTVEYEREQQSAGVKWARHPLTKDPETLIKIHNGVIRAADNHSVDKYLLLSMAWKESRFRADVLSRKKKGSKGEIGILQVHGVAARGCNLDTIDGQLQCGAAWLAVGFQECKSTSKAVGYYMSGKCISFPSARARVKLWKRMVRAISAEENGTNNNNANSEKPTEKQTAIQD